MLNAMRNFWLDCVFALYLLFKVVALAHGFRSFFKHFSLFSSLVFGLSMIYLPALLIDLFGVPSFVGFEIILNGFLIWGLWRLYRDPIRVDWATAIPLILLVPVWLWALRPFFGMSSGDDSTVHTYLLDQLTRHHSLLSPHNPVPFQDQFGPHRYLFYPTGVHAPLGALTFEWAWLNVDGQAIAIRSAFALIAAFTTIVMLPLLQGMLDPQSKWKWVLPVLCLFAFGRMAYPMAALREGALNRIFALAVPFALLFEGLFSKDFSDRRKLLWTSVLFTWLAMVHPSGSIVLLFGLSASYLEVLKQRRFLDIALSGAILAAGGAMVILASRTGSDHMAGIRDLFYPAITPTLTRDTIWRIYAWLRGTFWWQGDGFSGQRYQVIRLILFSIGFFVAIVHRRKLHRFWAFSLVMLIFSSVFLILVCNRQYWSYPLTMIFYNGSGPFTGRLAEIGYATCVGFVVLGAYQVFFWLVRVLKVRGACILLLVGIAAFLRPSVMSWSHVFTGTVDDFRPANAKLFSDLGRQLDLEHDQMVILPGMEPRAFLQMRGMLKLEPLAYFPECLPELKIDSDNCEKRLAYLEELDKCIQDAPVDSRQKCCASLRPVIPVTVPVVLVWTHDPFREVNFFRCDSPIK